MTVASEEPGSSASATDNCGRTRARSVFVRIAGLNVESQTQTTLPEVVKLRPVYRESVSINTEDTYRTKRLLQIHLGLGIGAG